MEDIFKDENIPETNWFKFSNIGDKVSGEVLEVSFKKSNNEIFADQRVFVLKQDNEEIINVGIKATSAYLMSKTSKIEVGDRVGFLFKEEIPAKIKGYNPAKSIECYRVPKQNNIEKTESWGAF